MEGRRDAAAILVDLQGPRIRVGDLAAPLRLEPGQQVVFAPEGEAQAGEIPTTYDALARDVRAGARILLDDGLLSAEVTGTDGDRVRAVVHYGGELKSHKGMNLPGHRGQRARAHREGPRGRGAGRGAGRGLHRALVRAPAGGHGAAARSLVPRSVKLIAKIEKDTALKNLCGILDASDAIMVARGDLGVELPFEEVPLMQKQIIREASLHGKPVITATQMLESMIHAPRPTRAEASDVANAILDGTDAVMLSAETAVGKYPVEAVRAMDRIAREMEAQRPVRGVTIDAALGRRSARRGSAPDSPRVPGRAGPHRGRDRGRGVRGGRDARARRSILCFTSSGFTARKVATCRPTVPVFACTPGAGDLPPALAGVGRDRGADPALDRLRRDARRGAPADPRARARTAGRAAGRHRGRAVRHARALPTS